MSLEVRSKDIPAQQVMSVNRDTFISDLQAHLDGSIKTLMVYAQASGAQISGLPLAIYRGAVREDRHAQVEICLPVTGQLRATIEIAVKELPAARVACATLSVRQSIYPGALKASSAIREWITDNEHAVDGTCGRRTSISTRRSSVRRRAWTTPALRLPGRIADGVSQPLSR